MSDPAETLITVEYGYYRMHSWYVRRGDQLVYMSRTDKYSLDHKLEKRGEAVEGSALQLNGWEPPQLMYCEPQ